MPSSRDPSPSRDRTWESCVSCIAGRFFTTSTSWEDPRNGCVHAKPLQSCLTLWTVAHQAPLSMGLSSKNTGVGCRDFLQGIFPIQGLNPWFLGFPHKAGSLPIAPPGTPKKWMPLLKSPQLKASAWMEKHQGNYHPTFPLHVQAECHRKVVICSALLTPPYVWPIALAHGLRVPHWLLLWRLWLHSLSLDYPINPANLQFSQDFCFVWFGF